MGNNFNDHGLNAHLDDLDRVITVTIYYVCESCRFAWAMTGTAVPTVYPEDYDISPERDSGCPACGCDGQVNDWVKN